MKNFHFCISGGDEIIFRSEEDYIRGYNTLALAAAETGAQLAADAIMSTHIHVCVRTDDVKGLIHRFWKSYTRYFNSKYGRQGKLGEHPFIVEIDGFYRWLTAICYVLRNPVHHGVAPTPFAYRHCSASSLFRKETGREDRTDILPRKSYYKYLPKGSICPEGLVMDSTGLILRETAMDINEVEHIFGTPRSFLFYMNRLSGEEWRREQEKDQSSQPPVTLEMMEGAASFQSLSEMLSNEHGRFDYRALKDMEVCTIIDRDILPSAGYASVYELSANEKQRLVNLLFADYRIPQRQARRCLACMWGRMKKGL